MTDFLAMGGYGWYVWGAYGLSFCVLALNVVAARIRNKAVKREVTKFVGSST
jgi:heme exporter protein D